MVQAIRKMDSLKKVILEGEIVAVDPEYFRISPISRAYAPKKKYGVEEAMQSYPVIVNIFDVLYNDAKSVTGYPYRKRRRILTELVEIGDLSDDDGASRDKASSNPKEKRASNRRGDRNGGKLGPSAGRASHGLERVRVTDSIQHSSETTIKKIRLITQIMSSDEKEIQGFMDSAIEAGCEGIMLKSELVFIEQGAENTSGLR